MPKRIIGFDFARALALWGMVLVNFKIAMNAADDNHWLSQALALLEGRAAALFVVLAGVGISLMTAKARATSDAGLLHKHRSSLLKRAALLVIIGLAYSPIWPADILHFYGFYIAWAALCFTLSGRALLLMALGCTLGFLLLLIAFPYEAGWNFDTLEYLDFWTPAGMLRHIFYNGFHPVFPWAAFLFIGMWLGRQDFHDRALRRRLFLGGLLIWGGTELASDALTAVFVTMGDSGIDTGDVLSLFGTQAMPPMPQYIVAGSSLAVCIIAASVELTLWRPQHWLVDALCKNGRMTLTIYVAHVLIGMGSLEAMGLLYDMPIVFSVLSAIVFNLAAVFFALLWFRRFRSGPLEWAFRKLAG